MTKNEITRRREDRNIGKTEVEAAAVPTGEMKRLSGSRQREKLDKELQKSTAGRAAHFPILGVISIIGHAHP